MPGDAARYVDASDWDKLVRCFHDQDWRAQLQQLFYPEKQARRGETGRQRPPGFLVSVDDDDTYQRVYDFLMESRELQFPDINRLTRLNSHDGRIVAQLLDHVIDWLGTKRAPAVNRRDNKKPSYRRDLIPALQHFDANLVRQARKRLTFVFLEDEEESNHASTASAVMQQEIVDFTIDHLYFFRTPAARAELAERMETDKEEAYARRFLRKEWASVLEIVRWYVQSDFRPEWGRHTDKQQRNAEGIDTQSSQQGLAKAMLEFAKGSKGETPDQAVLQRVIEDSDFRQKLDDWLREQYGQSNHQDKGGAPLEHGANVMFTAGTGASESAPARRFGSDSGIESQPGRRVEAESGASRRVESPVDGPAFQGITMVQEKDSAPVSGRTGNSHHSPRNRRLLPLSQPDPKSSRSQRAPTSSQERVIDGHTQRSSPETYVADKRTVSVQNPIRFGSTIVQPSPGAWRKGLKARS